MRILLTMAFLVLAFLAPAQEILVQEIPMTNGEIAIPGELTYPNSKTKMPLVIFVHGSGNADRNGNQGALANTNHIKLLADSLNGKGFAFYRYDKRNSIPENMPKMESPSIYDLVSDVSVVIDHFGNDERFNGLHLIGHSQGSLVAMLAVNDNVSSYTSLAGPGSTIDKALVEQITKQNKDLGKATELHIEELMATDTILEVNPFLFAIFAPATQKYLKEWIQIDPSEVIKNLKLPVLIINGKMDSQVTADDANKLKASKPEAQLILIPKMNHVLKVVEDPEENQASYYDPDFPLSRELVNTLVEFIKNHG